MAMWNDAGRFQSAGAFRGILYRFRLGEEAAGDDPPGDLWVDGALSWHPDREFRRTFPALVRAGAGGGGRSRQMQTTTPNPSSRNFAQPDCTPRPIFATKRSTT